jgi:phenylacetate-CoA ligase
MISPRVSRHLVYPLQERMLGRPTFAYLRSLECSQWLTRAEIEKLQLRKLKSLLASASLHSPWHARRMESAGVDLRPQAELTFDDLRRIPTMTRQDARANVATIHWPGVSGGSYAYNTGGSSGEPLQFYYGRARQASDAAGRIRSRRWWNVDTGDREAYVWGAPVELRKTDRIKTLRDRLLNQLVLNAFEMSPANMDAYLDALQQFCPACVYGYASSVALLAARARERGVPMRLPSLRVVCTTGEPLYPHQRSLIGEVFGVPVANEFGSRDIGFTAHESPGGEMELMSESIVLEVLDGEGNAVAPGLWGEAVMTGLHSDAQPFIRYRTGDMVRMSDVPGAAGRGLHVIAEIAGRTTDFVTRADGTLMHALAVIYVLRAAPGVAEFRLIQHTVRDVDVLIVRDAQWNEVSQHAVVAGLLARLGADVRVRVELVESIPPSASGKHRYVESRVALRDEWRAAAAEAVHA